MSRKFDSKTVLILYATLLFSLQVGCGGTAAPPPSTSTAAAANPNSSHSVQLSWARSASIDVLGYNVYRATRPGGPYLKLTPALLANPDYRDTTVAAGQTYYYAVTAATAIAESARSAEVVAVIPNP